MTGAAGGDIASGVSVRGAASAEEVAAVLAVLHGGAAGAARPAGVGGYERWRRTRLEALRRRSPRG
ncbi:MAG: acyl-CoA carboxylase epsilon subunit [Jatrophihabitans sp.]|uniref:acyl-CoA carboxylase epsilon subunit n=1 Tax=Jatrophihabitans sp. TaxID=1932789 RepID=UPI003F7E4ACA